MPSASRLSRRPSFPTSPPLSTASYSLATTATTATQHKLNIVTRLAVEGKAERDANGASIKMYLKMSLPLEAVTPGSSIPLFPEENLKIVSWAIHALDANSAPYNFPSDKFPLLHNAARALNLPARSLEYYSMTSSSLPESASVSAQDAKHTGRIVVSGYQVSWVLPKEFPRRESDPRSKRPSTFALFMAGIDIWVPFLSHPPFAPHLLSIPVPRCLSNHLRLKIFPPKEPKSTSTSLASLSSADEDGGAWDLTADPHVTRSSSSRLSRSSSYQNFADDESSDASTSAGFADGCGIQGTFPSTDRIRIRWAKPARSESLPVTNDGRRRVGIKEVKGELQCTILGTSQEPSRAEATVMQIKYDATCKGVWFPGVATLLGLDVSLDAGDCDVSWVPGGEPRWAVSGDTGFTGFAVGPPPTPPDPSLSRQSSADPPSIYVLPSSPNGRGVVNGRGASQPPSRHNSNSSTSSLLRAPLPTPNTADYSFESTPASTPMSSLASLPLPSSPEKDRRSRASSVNGRHTDTDVEDEDEEDAPAPGSPITIHVNMNELLPPSKNDLKFSITGVVIVTPRSSFSSSSRRFISPTRSQTSSDGEEEAEPVDIPRFRIPYADREIMTCNVRSEAIASTLDVYNSKGDLRQAQTRKTVLQKGGQIKCGSDGARVALRPLSSVVTPSATQSRRLDTLDISRAHRSVPQTPNGFSHRELSPSSLRSLLMSTTRAPPQRDGPLMIPSVSLTITPLVVDGNPSVDSYAVEVSLPAPSDTDSEWLGLGLALPSGSAQSSSEAPPKVDVASASVEGVSVAFDTTASAKASVNGDGMAIPFESSSSKDWITWIRVHVGSVGGVKVKVVYIVRGQPRRKDGGKGKAKARDPQPLHVLLPSFSLPVGQLQAHFQIPPGYDLATLSTNLIHQQSSSPGRQLVYYSMEEFFQPRLAAELVLASAATTTAARVQSPWLKWSLIPVALCGLLLLTSVMLYVNNRALKEEVMLRRSYNPEGQDINNHEPIKTVTITTTVMTSTTGRWRNPNPQSSPSASPPAAMTDETPLPSSAALPSPTLSSTVPTLTPTPVPPPTDRYALAPFYNFNSLWNLGLELPKFTLPEATKTTVDALVRGAEAVWHMFQRVLHYPLDPP